MFGQKTAATQRRSQLSPGCGDVSSGAPKKRQKNGDPYGLLRAVTPAKPRPGADAEPTATPQRFQPSIKSISVGRVAPEAICHNMRHYRLVLSFVKEYLWEGSCSCDRRRPDRTQTVRAFDSNLRTPYSQNWNLSIQRDLGWRTVAEARYVGGKGTKLIRGANFNEVNIFETGILEAFRTTQAGGNSPLLNTRFSWGLTSPASGS